jgi:SAM-dependent methyltransferase
MKGRLLDVGCGTRAYSLIYESLVERSVGTEVTFTLHGIGATDVICYAENLPFPQHSFNTVLCTEVLEHTRRPFQVMQELTRVLSPGGHLVLSVPFIYPIHEAPYDHWRFTRFGLAAICEFAGLKPLYIHAKGGTATSLFVLGVNVAVWTINLVSRLLHLRKPLRDSPIILWMLNSVQRIWLRLSSFEHNFSGNIYSPRMAVGFFLVAIKE